MAEFLSMEEADNRYGKKSKTNAALSLGIIGTALGAIGSGIFGNGCGCGNGIFGLGRNNNGCGCGYSGSAAQGAATMAAGTLLGAGINDGPTTWQMANKEMVDQEYDLVRMGQIEADALRTQMATREIDVKEKTDLYAQTLADNRVLRERIDANKDFTIQGLSDVYQASVAENRVLERQISNNQLEAYKNVSDLYASTVTSDKNLELQIERNREKDQAEKFALYKDLSEQTNKLAFDSMKQSYEDRMESMNQINCLANRVCALEAKEAVNSATIPLMFKLSESNTAGAITAATCRKIDGNLTLSCNQLCNTIPQSSINALYSAPFSNYGGVAWPYGYAAPTNYGCGCCGGTSTATV